MTSSAPRQAEGAATFWLTPASYWMPAHYPTSAWVTHAPFASWLIDALRPQSIAELGTHMGYSCFVFAEAVKRLRLPTTVSALDSWEGDDHAGFYGEDVFEEVQRIAESDYPESVKLVRGYFNDSRTLFADASIDLLHIDGRHAYADALEDYTQWLGTVREGGVILFHDIAERDHGFGVWKLWDEIAEPGRSFTFHHGHGLGVLGVGNTSVEALDQLFSADEQTADRIRGDFAALGERVARQAWLESLPAELDRVWAEVRHRAAHEDQQADAIERQHAHIAAMEQSTSWRVTAPIRVVGRLRPRRT
ncbi:class I SAM-dependent methyltransferase [Microbacterium aurum]